MRPKRRYELLNLRHFYAPCYWYLGTHLLIRAKRTLIYQSINERHLFESNKGSFKISAYSFAGFLGIPVKK